MAAKKETKTNNIVETEAVTQPQNNAKKEAFLKALADVSSMKNVGQIALLTDMREENVAKTSSGSIVLLKAVLLKSTDQKVRVKLLLLLQL